MKILLLPFCILVSIFSYGQFGPVIGQEFFRPGATQVGVDYRKASLNLGVLANFSFIKKDLDRKWLKYYPSVELTGSYYGTVYGGIIVGKKREFIINLAASYGMRTFPKNAGLEDQYGNGYGSFNFGNESFLSGGARLGAMFRWLKGVKVAIIYSPSLEYYLENYNDMSNNRNPWEETNLRHQVAVNLFFKNK